MHTTTETAVTAMVPQAEKSILRPEDILHTLRCGSYKRRNRQDAANYIASLGREVAQSLFSRGLRRKSLEIFTECILKEVDSDNCVEALLKALRILEYGEQDLAAMQLRLEALCSAAGTVGTLAQAILQQSRKAAG